MIRHLHRVACFLGLHAGCVKDGEELHSYATDLIAGIGITVWGGTCSNTGRYITWEQDA